MVAYLKIRSGPDVGRRVRLDLMRTMHIGRGANCEIVLSDPVASRFHAVIFHEDGVWQVRDMRSRNGMLVNGQKTDHATLGDSHIVTVGDTELQFYDTGEDADEQGRDGTVIMDRAVLSDSTSSFDGQDPLSKVAETGHLVDLYLLSL